MNSPVLYAPWRMDYIKSLDKPSPTGTTPGPERCFLCDAATAPPEKRRDFLVLWASAHCVVVINRYPYANGHLLIAPKSHKADLHELSDEEGLDLHHQTVAAVELLKRAVSAQGFNIGINLGRVAGAGVPGHVHRHVVPRWNGDTNFISVVGEVRVVPQAMSQLYDELVRGAGRES